MASLDAFLESARAAAEGFLPLLARQWVLFVALFLLIWIVARIVARIIFQRVLRARRVEVAIRQVMARVFVFATLLTTVFVLSNLIFEANVAALLATVGLVTVAVGFGLQNMIANIAGGISLALDRPFRIGDEIEVLNVVGTVQEIGIRSTRILTRRKQYVVIPNKMLEQEFITNYTMVYPELRLDVPVPIPYEADRERAEEILLEIAVAHPVVLATPTPRVLLRKFGDSAIELELRCWISHPRSRETVLSDVLKSAHNRLEEAGIRIPYPHRVIVQKPATDGEASKRIASKTWRDPRRSQRRILIPIPAGELPRSRARYAVALTKALKGQVIGLYVGHPADRGAAEDGGRILHELESEADSAGLWYKPILRLSEDPNRAVTQVAKEEDVDLIVLRCERPKMGLGRARWKDPHPVHESALRTLECLVPVHDVAGSGQITTHAVTALEARIQEYRKGEPAARVPAIEVSHPEPAISAVPTPPPEGPKTKEDEGAKG